MLLPASRNIRLSDDIPYCASIWQEKPTRLHIHLFNGRIRLSHVNQGVWYCSKINIRWSESIHPSFHIRIRNRRRRLHPSSDELL
jgi:hypothetical protein